MWIVNAIKELVRLLVSLGTTLLTFYMECIVLMYLLHISILELLPIIVTLIIFTLLLSGEEEELYDICSRSMILMLLMLYMLEYNVGYEAIMVLTIIIITMK